MKNEMDLEVGQLRLALQVQELLTNLVEQSKDHNGVEANMMEQWNKLSNVVKSLEEKYGVKSEALKCTVQKLNPAVIDLSTESIMKIRRLVRQGYTNKQIAAMTGLKERVVAKYAKTIFS